MDSNTTQRRPTLSVIVPASNEAALIGRCLRAVAASRGLWPGAIDAIVVANGCRDETAAVARAEAPGFAAQGWTLQVIERAEGGKLAALNAGDAAARSAMRVYLDADVTVGPDLLMQLAEVLDDDAPRYASGAVQIAAPDNWASRAYARIWRQVPFMAQGVPGCGLFAVNAAGRARWGAFPDIISDDTFVRLSFAPEERIRVGAPYRWPIAEGLGNLVRVRQRQDRGVSEITERFPHLLANDDKPAFPAAAKLGLALRDPAGFAVYAGVALLVRLGLGGKTGWSRGR
ncbi:glycosyltransferase family 2 protein [Thalassococcus sp. CAU 1522]|uniref:Glycosyltransferase family 2 protein n=1 Tax=Thalassococcus arenae TaxID=2851652 RepID=A0ABS6N691_9RHOB|nr:glycosyltransferase [Thalassococcus arenae]MBV2359542.1 glycosyltransferase family 2 protein [Thalassococcus arenae]